MTIENLNQETEILDLETEITEPKTELADPINDEVAKLNAKKIELLGKLKKEKSEHELSQNKITELQSELDKLKDIQNQFEEYKKSEYMEAVLFNVLDAVPSSKDFIKFQLEKMGYKVIYADNQLMDKREIIDGQSFVKQVSKTGYCFVNPNGELVDDREVKKLKDYFASYVYANVGSGTMTNRDIHEKAKRICELKDGVFVGKPQIKAEAEMIAKLYQSELEKHQEIINYYNREIPALLETAKNLPNQVLSADDKLQFGLK